MGGRLSSLCGGLARAKLLFITLINDITYGHLPFQFDNRLVTHRWTNPCRYLQFAINESWWWSKNLGNLSQIFEIEWCVRCKLSLGSLGSGGIQLVRPPDSYQYGNIKSVEDNDMKVGHVFCNLYPAWSSLSKQGWELWKPTMYEVCQYHGLVYERLFALLWSFM